MFVPALSPPRSSGHCHANSASTIPTHSIPIHPFSSGGDSRKTSTTTGITMKRSSSELGLSEEERQADLRDYIFYPSRAGNFESPSGGRWTPITLSCPTEKNKTKTTKMPTQATPHGTALVSRGTRTTPTMLQSLAHIIGTRNGSRDHEIG
ncbi:hypothetical protein ACA910_011619 [Epithemia clementina (nom. ined.)]